jgi:pyruvate kinase
MDRIAQQVEGDPDFFKRIHFTETPADGTTADALAEASGRIVDTVETSSLSFCRGRARKTVCPLPKVCGSS